VLTRRPPPFDHDADRVRRTDRRVRDIGWNKKRFPFADQVIDDLVAFADAHFDVALELVKIFFRIDQMEIVPGIRTFDDHDEEIAPIVEVAIADWRLEEIAIRFDPIVDIDRWQYLCRGAAADWFRW
jgi:hypothetical protein